MRTTILILGLALALAGAASGANSAPVKRLAWNKAAAVWTSQARKNHRAITCTIWSTDALDYDCIVYNPVASTSSTTFIKDGRHDAYGKRSMSRYDRRWLDADPHPGCTYAFGIYGPDLKFSSAVVVNICQKGWLAKVPAAP